jgi:hypothetical protein
MKRLRCSPVRPTLECGRLEIRRLERSDMDLRALFRRRQPRIADPAACRFIDRNAAFLVQKGIYEYARARAGHYSKVLCSASRNFRKRSNGRAGAYPLGLAMVGEMAEGMLRPCWGDECRGSRDAFLALVLSVFDRYPIRRRARSGLAGGAPELAGGCK